MCLRERGWQKCVNTLHFYMNRNGIGQSFIGISNVILLVPNLGVI